MIPIVQSQPEQPQPPLRLRQLMAWGVHLFTASGVVWGVLAVMAIFRQHWLLAFLWMAMAVAVDSFDGMLARRARVRELLPHFDGALLDNIVDYFNYVVVAVIFLYQADILPPGFSLAAGMVILLVSAYQFCQVDAKTCDHYFKGFPSYWNVTVFYMFMLGLNPWVNLAFLTFFALLVFVPIKYVYPSRTVRMRNLTIALTLVWGALTLLAILQFPNPQRWLLWASLLYVIYYAVLSLYSTVRQLRRTL